MSRTVTLLLLSVVACALLLAAFVSAGGASGEFPPTPSVVDLDDDNFEDLVEGAELALVEFYAPWCGHCKNLAPAYQQLAEHFNDKNKDMNILIAKVDATQHNELATKFGVRGYPTIKLFRKGEKEPKDYEGDRSAEGMRKYLEGQAGPAVRVIETKEALDDFVAQNKVVVATAAEAGTDDFKAFEKAANSLRDKLRFVQVTDASALSSDAKIVLFRDFDANAEYTGDMKKKAIVEWVTTSSTPLWGELTMSNARDHMSKNRPLLLLFLSGEEINTKVKSILEPLLPVAQEYSDLFAYVYLNNDQFGQHQDRLGLKGTTPAIAIDNYEASTKYPYSGELTTEAFREFVKGFKEGTLEPHMRSAEPPAENNEPVKVVVGKTFKDIVLDPTKDVMIEIYAPWCGHCKTLEPKYKELAEKFEGVNSVVIAKMDGTENDPPAGIKVSGFPTLIFFPANNKEGEGVKYTGGRETQDMYDFIVKNASIPVDGATISDQSSEGHDEL